MGNGPNLDSRFDQATDTSAVTLEDLEAYLERNTRDILAPVLPGQNRATQQFQSGTSGAAPPPAHVEGGDTPTPSNPPADVADFSDDSDDDEVASGVDAEGTDTDDGEADVSVPDAPVESTPAEQPELIEVSPGQFMTKEAISTALATREQPPVVEVGQAPAATTSAPVAAEVPELAISQEMLDDPDYGPLYRVMQAQQHAIAEQSRQLAFVSDIAVSRAQEELGARVTAGLNQFKEAKKLDDAQLTAINEVAVRLNIMGSLSSGIDPITGAQIPRDPQTAAYRAMEIAYWQMPEYRDLELSAQVTARAKDSRRKQKLAGVSGGSGSVPRTTSVPNDRRGREIAAVTELRELMSPGSAED